MFKLSFFLIFVFAGLCFGNSETVEGAETSNVNSDGTSDSEGTSGKESDSGTSGEPLKLLNTSIPNFVGSYENKRSLLSTFIDNCEMRMKKTSVDPGTLTSERSSNSAINLASVHFDNCTFVCKPPNKGETFMMPMPKGTVCDIHNNTCPGDGPCPTPSIPAC
uniref:Putative conserved secreted protein n=1 Tax=Ixodes ricinus TaxID=34613 RepID=A0A6B0UXX4_IXORI